MELTEKERKKLIQFKGTLAPWFVIIERVIYIGLIIWLLNMNSTWGNVNLVIILVLVGIGVFAVVQRMKASTVVLRVIDHALKGEE